jgi:hypothetical protein
MTASQFAPDEVCLQTVANIEAALKHLQPIPHKELDGFVQQMIDTTCAYFNMPREHVGIGYCRFVDTATDTDIHGTTATFFGGTILLSAVSTYSGETYVPMTKPEVH